MAESRAKIEFQTKKELFEAIANQVACSFCRVVPRKGPIYQSNELLEPHQDYFIYQADYDYIVVNGIGFDVEKLIPVQPETPYRKTACGDCFQHTNFVQQKYHRNETLENIVFSYPITSCKFRKWGCKVVQDLKNIEYHEEDCEFRDIFCPISACEQLNIFKEFNEHISDEHDVDFKSEDDTLVISDKTFTIKEVMTDDDIGDYHFYSTHHFVYKNRIFFLQITHGAEFDGDKRVLMLWLQLCGSKFEAKNYNCSIKMGDSIHGQNMFKGPVKSLDDRTDKWFKEHYGLVVSWDFAKKFIDDEDSLTVEIEIEDLKPQEEQTDYDEPMEAATDAATADDDKEKDSKNR